MPIVYVLLLLLVLISLYFYRKERKYAGIKKLFWSPPSLPIIGAVHNFLTVKEKDMLPMAENWMLKHGPDFLLNLMGNNYLTFTDPKRIEFVLGSTKLIDKSREYEFLHDWFGTGLLTSTGTKWKHHRKILTPSFHYKILEEFVKVFDKQSTTLIGKLSKDVGTEAIDIFKYISLCTLDIICETAMGTEMNAQEDPDSPFVRSVREMCNVFYSRVFTPLRFNCLFVLSKTYRKQKEVIKIMRTFSETVINKRVQDIAKESEAGYQEDEVGLKKKYTFLDCLLRAKIDGEPISYNDIREEVDTFMFEGHDTTSIAISFVLYCLSKNPDIQDKVYQEIQKVYGGDNTKNSTCELLNELKYLERVIKESLRLYPPVSIIARMIEEDITYDGMFLPKGLTIILFPYISHRNPSQYPEPHKFDPDRFTIENQAKRHPYAYIPFSAGPRNCIGQKFAMLEIKCTVAKILRYYEILPASADFEVKPLIHLTLESENGIMMKLKERK